MMGGGGGGVRSVKGIVLIIIDPFLGFFLGELVEFCCFLPILFVFFILVQ